MKLQLGLFWLVNLFREDTITLLISVFAVRDKESILLLGFLLSACLVLAFIKYSTIPEDKKTVWHFAVDIEKTRENERYKLLSSACVFITGVFTFYQWRKEADSGDLMTLASVFFSIFMNASQIRSILTYDGPYHDKLEEDSMELAKIKLPEWMGPIRYFWCDSEKLLTDLQFFSVLKNSKSNMSMHQFRSKDRYRHLPWEIVEDLDEKGFSQLGLKDKTVTMNDLVNNAPRGLFGASPQRNDQPDGLFARGGGGGLYAQPPGGNGLFGKPPGGGGLFGVSPGGGGLFGGSPAGDNIWGNSPGSGGGGLFGGARPERNDQPKQPGLFGGAAKKGSKAQ